MRFRILAPLTALVLVAGIALVVVLIGTFAENSTRELVLSRHLMAARLSTVANRALAAGDTVELSLVLEQHERLFGEPVMVIGADGTVVAAAGAIDPDHPEVATASQRALRDLPTIAIDRLRPWRSPESVLAQPLYGGGDLVRGALVLEVNTAAAQAQLQRRVIVVVGTGVAGVVLAVLAAMAVTRWVLRPVRELESAATTLAAGERAPVAESGPPELRQLSRTFEVMSDTVIETLEQQRRFIADSSHQLRTPLAGVRLRVDSLALALADQPDERDLAELTAAVDADLDRLQLLVDDLLRLSEAEHRVTSVTGTAQAAATSATEFLDEVGERWMQRAAERGLELRTAGDDGVVIPADPAVLHHIVDALVENAVKYAADGTAVDVQVAGNGASGNGVGVSLSVFDDGAGLGDVEFGLARQRFWRSERHSGLPGTGLGLPIVDQLARSQRGALSIGRGAAGGLQVTISWSGDADR